VENYNTFAFAAIELRQQELSGRQRIGYRCRQHMPIPSQVITTRVTALQITALQSLDKHHDASESVAQSCNCEFAIISRCISETLEASAKLLTQI